MEICKNSRIIKTPVFHSAYAQCVNDPYCAARAVQGYMAKYAQVRAHTHMLVYTCVTYILLLLYNICTYFYYFFICYFYRIVTATVISIATIFFVFIDSEDTDAVAV